MGNVSLPDKWRDEDEWFPEKKVVSSLTPKSNRDEKNAASILQEKWAGGEVCDDCGSLVGPHTDSWWHADDDLWLEVMEQGDPGEGLSGRRVGPGCLCPPCFTARCDAKGVHIFWHARVEHREGEDVIEGQRRAGLRV